MPVLSHPQPDAGEELGTESLGAVDTEIIDSSVTVFDTAEPTETAARPRRLLPALIGVGAVGAVAAGVILLRSNDDATEPVDPVTVRTVSAETRDLIEFSELDGRVVDTNTRTITAATDGVVTAIAADGAEVARGDDLYEINGVPVTLFYGDTPLYRELVVGVEGDDVAVLEANLASLGYHTFDDEDGNQVDTGFVVDGVFDVSTDAAVVRWQEDRGSPATGSVSPADVVVTDGPAEVTEVSLQIGDRATQSTPAIQLDVLGDVDGAFIEHTGDIELFVTSGSELTSGAVVYSADDAPITAIVSDATFDRDLAEGISAGDDVAAIEEMLRSLGYDADGDLEVDDEFDEFTTQAITDFEDDLANTFDETAVDGVLTLDEFIVFEPGSSVGTLAVLDAEAEPTGAPLWSTTTSVDDRIVETEIAVSDQAQLAEGSTVDVEFPDGSVVPGTVTDLASSSTVDPTNPDADPTLAVEIELSSIPDSAAGLNELDVTVLVVDEIATGATVVPASALVATGDGGFAVEALTSDGGTRFVAVEPGMFNDGFVEVTGIQPGTQIVVPS